MSTRSNPFEELERLFERMSRQLEESSRKWEPEGALSRWAGFEEMAIDLVERGDEFAVTVDLPGFERDDVEIEVTDHTLHIDAEREEATEEEAAQYLRRERRHESMHRSIQLPDEVDKTSVKARMKNGVLTVTLPKLEVEEPRTIEIE
ncbi:Hsp20/alpha crystallin family protein [Halapricum desulfuricans]|uniref:Molecular chaperone (HSP20 family) n=1 Tax=Halapricum desulfuricans TaxID=2841257 RepID=A0A897N8H4_9EURY|nr:Hsp20/alpha crystallin family protein [Halapricum desulfuricans]QSG06686.1 Molecular chaperone (HSP20 family) [Halapricum desulfuricans]